MLDFKCACFEHQCHFQRDVRWVVIEKLTLLWKYLSDSGKQAVASELNTKPIDKWSVQLWKELPPRRYSVSSYASIAPDQAPSPVSSLSLSVSLFFLPIVTLKASWRTMWNLIGWCIIGSPWGGMAKCREPSLVTRLADKGRTWGIGPILFAQRMVQNPSGPCKEMLGFSHYFTWALSLWFDNWIIWNVFDASWLDLHFTFKR